MSFRDGYGTFCRGWSGDDTTTVLQTVSATKKSMMSARSEGSWDMGWRWKWMKFSWLPPSFTLSRSWGSGVMSFSWGQRRRKEVGGKVQKCDCRGSRQAY